MWLFIKNVQNISEFCKKNLYLRAKNNCFELFFALLKIQLGIKRCSVFYC